MTAREYLEFLTGLITLGLVVAVNLFALYLLNRFFYEVRRERAEARRDTGRDTEEGP